jgi:glycosyltransferase involved in cell wall biosynthesis
MKKTIFSLNAQSLLPSEVIVTDDGSNVDMLGALKEISSKLRFELKYVRQNHRGFRAAKARNNGVRYSKNEYLVFYDQDIISTKNYLSKFVENSDPSKFIVSYPIRLTEVQTALINENMIADCDFDAILFAKQKLKIKKQFMKDYYSHLKKNLGLNKKGPKLRS